VTTVASPCAGQAISTTCNLKRPELLEPLFFRLLACHGYRQIAREAQLLRAVPPKSLPKPSWVSARRIANNLRRTIYSF